MIVDDGYLGRDYDWEPIVWAARSVVARVFAQLYLQYGCPNSAFVSPNSSDHHRKLPFYLQKFQFEVWTLLFGLGGTFGFVPLVAMVLDLCDGHNESVVTGPQFVKNWPLSYRAAVYSSKEALTKWNYEAKYSKYVESEGALTEKPATITIPNR